MVGNNTPPEIVEAAKFVLDSEAKLKAAKALLSDYVEQHGDIIDHENDIKIMKVVRQLISVNEEAMTEHRRRKIANVIHITPDNVFVYAKSEDIAAAGYTAETNPDLFVIKTSVSIKTTHVPKKERKVKA